MNFYVVIGLLIICLLSAVAVIVAMRNRLLKYLGGLISLYTRLEVERTFARRRGDDVEVIDEMLEIATDALSEHREILNLDTVQIPVPTCGVKEQAHYGRATLGHIWIWSGEACPPDRLCQCGTFKFSERHRLMRIAN